MSRMDRYNDTEYENEEQQSEDAVLSRVSRNQIMYDDVYFNRTKVDIDSVMDNDSLPSKTIKTEVPIVETYEEKSYSVNEFIEKAHENKSPDNLKRDIDDTEFKEQEDEIRKLIESIDEKAENEDFFKDLKGENEDTLIGAKLKTDEFNDSIYEALKSDNLIDENSVLDHVLSDKTVLNLEKQEDEKLDHTFEKILLEDRETIKKKNKLPIIIFCTLLFILIVVIIVIFVIKK